jgi:hypothetical protein
VERDTCSLTAFWPAMPPARSDRGWKKTPDAYILQRPVSRNFLIEIKD